MPSRSILENQVIEWISSETDDRAVERILWISQANDVVFSISLEDDKAFPVIKTYTEIIAGIEANLCKPIDWINSNIPLLEHSIDHNHLLLRDKAWDAIKDIVSDEPDCFDKKWRGVRV